MADDASLPSPSGLSAPPVAATTNRLLAQAARARFEADVIRGIATTACLLDKAPDGAVDAIDAAVERMALAHTKYQPVLQRFGALLATPSAAAAAANAAPPPASASSVSSSSSS